MLKKMRKNEKGFTLAELLIVVAIIGVLVAISIPIFTSQLEKSREAVDMANIRSAYAEVAASALTDPDTSVEKTVYLKQTQEGWQTDSNTEIAGCKLSEIKSTPTKDSKVTIAYVADGKGAGSIKIGDATVSNSSVTTSTTSSSNTAGKYTG